MNESISRAAGASHGQEMPPERMEEAIRAIGRMPRQRTTLYGTPDPERVARSYGAEPLVEPLNPHVSDAGSQAPVAADQTGSGRRLVGRLQTSPRPHPSAGQLWLRPNQTL